MQKEIKIYDYYQRDRISNENIELWKKIKGELNQLSEEDTLLLDFKDVEIKAPWESQFFKLVFKDKRLKFRFYNNGVIKNTLDMLGVLEGIKESRVENIKTEDDIQEKQVIRPAVIRIKDRLIEKIEENDTECYIPVYKAVSQINYDDTFLAVKMIMDERPNKTFKIDFKGISISSSILRLFIGLQNTTIISTDTKTNERVRLYKSLKNCTVRDKVHILKEKCGVNTVGLISRYKETCKKDEFGRRGNGEPISCRPAIIRKIFQKDKEVFVEVEIFYTNGFETNSTREARGEEAQSKLNKTIERIPINEIGYDDYFVGSLYQFYTPIHEKGDELYTTYKFDGIRYNKIQVTLPKLIKMVFDEFGVNYNVTKLLQVIGMCGKDGI